MTDFFSKFTEVLPSGQDNEERDVHEEEEGEIEHWSEEEWEQWEFPGEDDVEEDQEYKEDEEDDYDDDDDEEEEEEQEKEEDKEKGEGGASFSMDLCVVCVTRPRNASIIHGDTGHQVCCLECASRLKIKRRDVLYAAKISNL